MFQSLYMGVAMYAPSAALEAGMIFKTEIHQSQ